MLISYKRIESHKKEPESTRTGMKVAPVSIIPQTAIVSLMSCVSKILAIEAFLRWLYTISSVFVGSDIYFFLDVLILQLCENIRVQT